MVLGFGTVPTIVLGGVTYVSSSGIIAKLLSDLGRTGDAETPAILSILVVEDLMMALYLPIVGALLAGENGVAGLLPALVAAGVVIAILVAASRIEIGLSRLLFSKSDEALLLTLLGLTLLIAGVAESVEVSAAVAALVIGIGLSGPAAESAQTLLSPLRDLFAALFFGFVGLSVDPSSLPPVLVPAALLAAVGVGTKVLTGWLAAKRAGVGTKGRLRAGVTLVARGDVLDRDRRHSDGGRRRGEGRGPRRGLRLLTRHRRADPRADRGSISRARCARLSAFQVPRGGCHVHEANARGIARCRIARIDGGGDVGRGDSAHD